MELTINTSRFEVSRNVAENASETSSASGAQKADGQMARSLVSTSELPECQGDDFARAVDAISPETFSRDDDLGRLVSSAFNFPAPPMPEFK